MENKGLQKKKGLLKSRIPFLAGMGYLAVTVLIIYVGIVSYNRYKKDLIAAEQKELLMIAETIGKSLVNYIEQELSRLNMYCRMVEDDHQEIDREYLKRNVRIYLEKNEDLYTAAICVDNDGQVIPLFGQMDFSAVRLDDSDGAVICGKGLTEKGGYQLYLARRCCWEDNSCYLIFAMELNKIYQKIVAPVRIGEGGYSVVKDSDLSIIMHHAANQIGMDAVYDRSERYPQLDLSDLTAWIELQRRQPEGVGMIHSYMWDDPDLMPEERIIAYTTIKIPGETWIVNSTIPYKEIDGPLRLMLQRLIVICLVFISVLSVSIIIITRNLVRFRSQKKEINYLREINAGMELLRHKEEELQHYQRVQTIGQMSSQIAHEFNNYLTPVMVYAELLEGDDRIGEENQNLVQGILKSTNQAAELSRKLLDFSRQETSVLFCTICLTEDVKTALQIIRQLAPQKISVEDDLDDQNFYIQGQNGMVGHLLMNLCNNAFHAMDAEGGTLTVRLALAGPQDFAAGVPIYSTKNFSEGSWVVLSVRDTGCGMDEEILDKIFEPFYTTKGRGKGTGLGLSVIHNIVKAAEGVICVATEPGKGSCFSLFFQALSGEKEEESKREKETEIKKKNAVKKVKSKSDICHVVVVDDEPELLYSLGSKVRSLGHSCELFQHPATVISKIQKHPDYCDLIITDYSMPYMNGVELCELIRKLNPRIRLILMSGTADIRFNWYLKNAFIDEFILKTDLAKNLPQVIKL